MSIMYVCIYVYIINYIIYVCCANNLSIHSIHIHMYVCMYVYNNI